MFVKLLYFVLGVSISTLTAYALTFSTEMDIVEEQAYALRFTGNYIPDVTNPQLQVHTYEKLCKGFVIIEETPTAINYIGYGDLANDYTYTIKKDVVDISAKPTSTPVIGDSLINI